jgi:hypothetical protein
MRADPSGLLDIFGFTFDSETVGGGLQTGLAAVGSAFSFGLWSGGEYRNTVGFGTSYGLAVVGREAAIAAATMGSGSAISAGVRNLFPKGAAIITKALGGNIIAQADFITGEISVDDYLLRYYGGIGSSRIQSALAHEAVHRSLTLAMRIPFRYARAALYLASGSWRVGEEYYVERALGSGVGQAAKEAAKYVVNLKKGALMIPFAEIAAGGSWGRYAYYRYRNRE